MNTQRIVSLLVLILIAVLPTGCLQSPSETGTGMTPLPTQVEAVSDPDQAASDTMTLVMFVENARKYAIKEGREKSVAAFNDPQGAFVSGELYIFAYDFNGTVLALPFQPELIGTDRNATCDIYGSYYIREMIATARNGSGFVRYQYQNPSEQYAYEPKLSYVARVDDTWWLGSGIYLAHVNESRTAVGVAPMTKEQIRIFVESAAEFAEKSGKEVAIETFMNTSGPFVNGSLYIYALDFQGNVLALPFQPERVGTSMLDVTDPTGQQFTRVEIDLARKGGGFVYYLYPNPAHNFTVEPKLSYVRNVEDSYWIGAGAYLSDINISA